MSNHNEEILIDMPNLFEVIRKRFLIILIFTILGLSGAFAYNYNAIPMYQSETKLYVQPVGESGNIEYNDLLTSERLARTHTEIIKSRKVISQVIKNLDLKMSYGAVLGSLNVSVINNTQLISIKVLTDNPDKSKLIANEVAKIYIAEVKVSKTVENIQIIDKAVTNKAPVSPNIMYNYIIGIALGFAFGFLIGMVIEASDNTIKNHLDVKKYLKVKNIGVVPHNDIDEENGTRATKKKIAELGTDLKVLVDPTSSISESYRMIRTNLNFLDLNVVNITSTVAGEGKSELLANLAVTFAMIGKKTIIVDCDLRKPRVHKNFRLQNDKGVADIILRDFDYKDVKHTFDIPNSKNKIDVITAGGRVLNHSELLNNVKYKVLIDELRKDYDLVLIDCPPVSLVTDAVVVSKLADGTVYVIESDNVDYKVIQASLEQIEDVKGFVVGTVLTKINLRRQKKLYGHKYEYYYSDTRR